MNWDWCMEHIKPLLTKKHRMDRLKYVFSQIHVSNVHQSVYKLRSINRWKWFYVSGARKNLKYLPNETIQYKSHVDIVMVTPHYQSTSNDDKSDGKIGLIVHGDFIQTQRRSVNRERVIYHKRSTLFTQFAVTIKLAQWS